MGAFNLATIGWGVALSVLDAASLPLVRSYSLGWLRSPAWLVLAMALYALQPLIFLGSLSVGGMAVMNVMWDVASDVIIALGGVLFFKERLNRVQVFGLVLGACSMVLLAYEED